MRLQVQGRVQTGLDKFDHGLGAAAIWQDAPGGPILVVNSGAQGGMSTWRIAPSGEVSLVATQDYSTMGTRAARDQVELVPFRGEMLAFFGLGTATFWGQAIAPDGHFGATRLVGFERAQTEIMDGNADFLRLWATMRDDAPPGQPDLPAWAGTTGLAQAGTDLLVTGGTESGLRVLGADAAPKLAGAELGIAAPTGLAVFGSGETTRLVVAGAGGSSLSVLRAGPDGYVATDHVIDTGRTAFAHVQAVAGVSVDTPNGPLDLVLAGGGDHGVTLFALTPDARLVWLDTLFDTDQTGLHNLATLTATLAGDRVVITATSQRHAGLTVLTLTLDSLGGIAPAGQGGAADDILVARPGTGSLTGGAGADVFVMRAGLGPVTITDFTPEEDRLDLRDWPMLRDLSQLDLTPTATGAAISYRDQSVQITTAAQTPLTMAELFPQGLDGADRMIAQSALSDSNAPQAKVLRVTNAGGTALDGVQVLFLLADGSQSLRTAPAGMLDLPVDPPALRVDAKRAHAPLAGDPDPGRDDALDVLRLALGLAPSFGTQSPQHYIAADFDRDGIVSSADALAVLRYAMGFQGSPEPEWLFFDAATDWDSLALSRHDTDHPTGLDLTSDGASAEPGLTGLLLGVLTDEI